MKKGILLIILLIACLAPGAACAQERLEKIAHEIEKLRDSNCTLTEQRDPVTKKIKQTLLVVDVPQSFIDKVLEAIEAERPNADSYTYNSASHKYHLTFTENGCSISCIFHVDQKPINMDREAVQLYTGSMLPVTKNRSCLTIIRKLIPERI